MRRKVIIIFSDRLPENVVIIVSGHQFFLLSQQLLQMVDFVSYSVSLGSYTLATTSISE